MMRIIIAVVGALFLMGNSSVDAQQEKSGIKKSKPQDGIRAVRNVPYVKGFRWTDRQKLDWVIPPDSKRSKNGWPILVFVHGGSWVGGSKNNRFERYPSFAKNFAEQGVLTVMVNYRLSPWVKHPSHVRDVAKAVKFVHDQAAAHGGDPKRIFVGGHSAGGHIAALLAVHEKYLSEVNLKRSDIRGVVSVSGVFDLREIESGMKSTFGETTGPFLLRAVFGSRKAVHDASPIVQIEKKNSPVAQMAPILAIAGSRDLWGLRDQARVFVDAFKARKGEAEFLELADAGHLTTIWESGKVDSMAHRRILKFMGLKLPAAPTSTVHSSGKEPSKTK